MLIDQGPGGKLSTAQAALAGSMAGVTETFANCPFETVKVRHS